MRQAHDLGYNVVVVTDAVGAFEDAQNEFFKKHVLHHFGHGVTTEELLEMLAASE
ncbi:MAG: isochorismatase family protein [Fimbriimonadaceae bacterium]